MISKKIFAAVSASAAAFLLAAFPSTGVAQNTTTYTYDSNYNVHHTLTTPGIASSMTYQYDTGGLDVTVPEPGGITTRYQYDATYHQTSSTNTSGDGIATTYDYNTGGAAVSDTVGGNTTTYIYDSANNQVGSISTTGDVTSTTYDSLNRQIAESEPGPSGFTTTYIYDSAGNTIESITTPGSPDTSAYDAYDRMLSITTDTGGNSTTYNYDANSNYAPSGDVVDPGRVTTYTYDALGRSIVGVPDPSLGRTTIYQYDPIGKTFAPETTVPGDVVGLSYDTVNNVLYGTSVPEPATFGLLATSAIALLARRRRA
jgi:YD repeat-containing protein